MTDEELLITCDGQGKSAKREALSRLIRAEREACVEDALGELFDIIEDDSCEPFNSGVRCVVMAIRRRAASRPSPDQGEGKA